MSDELADMVVAVAVSGDVFALEAPEGFVAHPHLSLARFACLPDEPGIYAVRVRKIGSRIHVAEYEEYRLVRSGEVVTIPTPAEPPR